MKLIVGFGNPGNQYNFTRHNSGFLALDFYTKIKNLTWETAPKYNAIYLKTTPSDLGLAPKSKTTYPTQSDTAAKTSSAKQEFKTSFDPNETIYFIKPQGFYNTSGIPTAAFAHFYKIPHANILIVCDDFNLVFGTTRLREQGTDGGNNGLKSCIKELGSTDFPRLRLGTGNDTLRRRIGDTDFVLGKFTPEEREKLPAILRETSDRIDNFILKS